MSKGCGAGGLRLGMIGVLAAATALAGPRGGGAKDPVALVVPAREAIVRMAFDMAAMRPVVVVSYQTVPDADAPLLHVWDAGSRRWVETSLESYGAGALFSRMPRTAYLMGTENEFPSKLDELAGWADRKVRLSSMDVVTCLNAFHEAMRFTSPEWRWLSRRYGLELKDQNEQRRRYGRYGPPGQAPRSSMLPPGAEPVPADQGAVIPAVPPAEEPPALVQPPVAPPVPVRPAAPPEPAPAPALAVEPPVK